MASQQFPTVGSRVLVSGGKKVGTVKALVAGSDGQQVVAFTVEHGLIHRRVIQVPMSAVKWVNPGNVVLAISATQFDSSPDATVAAEMADESLKHPATQS
ncbi:MAG TPA: PRC-barrel domain-containing protein [Thermomicrobiaceae bacterium]|nr:PRC-barrel domain-containing protein [Thermomicrobiaceae bacterium]